MLRIVRLFISHAFFAACCAVALCVQTQIWLHQPISLPVLIFVFFATVASYNYHFFIAAVSQYPVHRWPRLLFHHSHGRLILPALVFAGSCYPFLSVSVPAILIAVTGSFLYSLPLWPGDSIRYLRKAGIVKTVLLAFIWTWVSFIAVPLSLWNKSGLFPVLFGWKFLLVFLLCMLFDRRDQTRDLQKGFHSIATDLPAQYLTMLYAICCMIWGMLSGILTACLWHPAEAAGQWLIFAGVVISWKKLQQQTSFWYYYLLVDGYMFLSGIISIFGG